MLTLREHAPACAIHQPDDYRCTCGIRSNLLKLGGSPFLVNGKPEDVDLPANSTSPFCVRRTA